MIDLYRIVLQCRLNETGNNSTVLRRGLSGAIGVKVAHNGYRQSFVGISEAQMLVDGFGSRVAPAMNRGCSQNAIGILVKWQALIAAIDF
ncbi:hypothetical protein D3C81_1557680 [compost metagenome]